MEIRTLIQDIYKFIEKKDGRWFTPELAEGFSGSISRRLTQQPQQSGDGSRDPPRRGLRLSRMGPRCPRALWYEVNHPELAEVMPPWAEIKFSYGHILEALLIGLSKAAGHEVTGEQDELFVDGIRGHRDCVIDGCVVDVKSSSSRSFQKFKDGTLGDSDMFGYLDQLDGYLVGSADDPLVRVKDKGYLLAIDKTLGHMCLYEHHIREESIRERIRSYKSIVSLSEPPHCRCETVPDGGGGNIALGVNASYNAFKHCCWPHLRTFLYASGPRYLTKVVKLPKNKDGPITEIDKNGKLVYN